MQTEQGKIPPPPGLIASLISGFNSVANHILVITLPVLLDLYLWLGPHLRIDRLMKPYMAQLPPLPSLGLLPTSSSVGTQQQVWTTLINQLNLFGLLQTFPVGVSSLMRFSMPTNTPLGAPAGIEVQSAISVIGWWVLLVVLGWLLGGLYYHWVTQVSLKPGPRSIGQSLKQTAYLSIIWIAFLFIFSLPVLVVIAVVSFFSLLAGEILQIVIAVLALWLLLPIFFSPHGIFTYQQDAFRSILNSLRMVRFTLPNTGLFLMAFVLVGQGQNLLWTTSPDISWLTLVGIAGHAFVSTGLLAGSFIYYRDINAWLQVIFEQLRAQANSVKV